jgi:hypothetical protein
LLLLHTAFAPVGWLDEVKEIIPSQFVVSSLNTTAYSPFEEPGRVKNKPSMSLQ